MIQFALLAFPSQFNMYSGFPIKVSFVFNSGNQEERIGFVRCAYNKKKRSYVAFSSIPDTVFKV